MKSMKYLEQKLGGEALQSYETIISKIMRQSSPICPYEKEPKIELVGPRVLKTSDDDERRVLALTPGRLTQIFTDDEYFKKWVDLMRREEPSIFSSQLPETKLKTMFSKPKRIKQVSARGMDDSTEDHESCNRPSIK